MEAYVLTQDDKVKFGGIKGEIRFVFLLFLIPSIILLIILLITFSPIPLFLKICLGVCPAIFFAAKRLTSKEITEDSILLKIDESGIAFRPDSNDTAALIEFKDYDYLSTYHPVPNGLIKLRWKEIRNIKVKAGRSVAIMQIKTTSNTYYFDLVENGAVRYYTFRHKLRKFADDKSKIKCPLTTIDYDFGID